MGKINDTSGLPEVSGLDQGTLNGLFNSMECKATLYTAVGTNDLGVDHWLGVCNDLFRMGAGAVFRSVGRLGQADVYLVAHLPRLFPTIYCLESRIRQKRCGWTGGWRLRFHI